MKTAIVSGYFNPLHLGHLNMIKDASSFSDKLIIIVNNDIQQVLKKGKIIMDENERFEIVSAIKYVDEAIISIDKDATVRESLKLIGEKYPNDELIFCNGGDRNSVKEIPEGEICNKYNIELKFGVGGDFKQNSSSNINQLNQKE